MAYEFQKLSEVEPLTEVPEGARVLVEVDGDIKRVPGNGLGGNGGKTLVIIDSGSNVLPSGDSPETADSSTRFTANMTLNEAGYALYNRELTSVCVYRDDNGVSMNMYNIQDISSSVDIACLVIFNENEQPLYWTEDGITYDEPLPPK